MFQLAQTVKNSEVDINKSDMHFPAIPIIS